MNTKLLKCFQIVYEEKSINRAAGRLYITPQGLSRNIRQLEEELDVQLFQRTARGMEPTESGHFLYEKSGRIIRELEEIEKRKTNSPSSIRMETPFRAFVPLS